MATRDSRAEVEPPSYFYHHRIGDSDTDTNMRSNSEWKIECDAILNNGRDDSISQNDCDEQSQSSVFSPSIKQTCHDIDGVLNEIRLRSSPDPNDCMFRNGNYYNGYDDAMSDVSAFTTNNLVRELNKAHESFLDSAGAIQDRFDFRSSDTYENDLSLAWAGGTENEWNDFIWPEGDKISKENHSGEYCDYLWEAEWILEPSYHRNRGNAFRGFKILSSWYKRVKQRNRHYTNLEQTPSSSSRLGTRRISTLCALLGVVLVIVGITVTTTTWSSKQEQRQPTSIVDSHNPTSLLPGGGIASLSPMPIDESSKALNVAEEPEHRDSSSSPTQSLTPAPTIPLYLDDSVTSHADTLPPVAALPVSGSRVDAVKIDVDENFGDTTTNRGPPSLPNKSLSVVKLPVSGATHAATKESGSSLPSSTSSTLPISGATPSNGVNLEAARTTSSGNRSPPVLPTSQAKLPISGSKATVNIDSNEESTEKHPYLATNEKDIIATSQQNPPKESKKDKKKADNSIPVRRALRNSSNNRTFGKRPK